MSGVIEKLLFHDLVVIPSLISQFLEANSLVHVVLNLEDPADDYKISRDEDWTHAPCLQALDGGQGFFFVLDQRWLAKPWRSQRCMDSTVLPSSIRRMNESTDSRDGMSGSVEGSVRPNV